MTRTLSFSLLLALVLALAPAAARADERALQDIAARFASDGDLAAARAALDAAKATPEALLDALRRATPREAYAGGEQTLPLEDGHGGKTDLYAIAPSEEDAKAAEKDGGLTTIVALHGLGGNGKQLLPISRRIAPRGRTLILAPTAKRVPSGMENDDIPLYDMAVPHWWLYKSAHSFPLEGLRVARRRWPIDPDRIVLFGYSMGGFGAWNIGLRYADRFAGIAPCAGGISRREILFDKDDDARALLGNARLVPAWFTHGSDDQTVPVALSRKLHDALGELEIPHVYREIPGGHHILPMLKADGDVASLSQWVGERKRDPAPAKVEFLSPGDHADGAYWLRIARRTKKSGNVRIAGTIDRAKNAVSVELSGPADALDVYLDDRLLDLSKPVTVTLAGKAPWKGTRRPEATAVLESWRSREDPRLVYPARVRVELGREFK